MSMDLEKPNILLVDDQAINRHVLERALSPLPIKILTAKSGQHALDILFSHPIALVLLDVVMPDMDGYEVASIMHAYIKTKHIPIVFVTAVNTDKHLERQGYDVGAIDYLVKPIDPNILRSKVQFFVNVYRKQLLAEIAQIKMQELNHRYESLLDGVGEGILGINADGQISYMNPAAEQLLKTGKPTLIGRSILTLFPHEKGTFKPRIWEDIPIYKACSSGRTYHVEHDTFTHKDTDIPVEYTATPIINENVFDGVVLIFQDISMRMENEQALMKLSKIDGLTGLGNRAMLNERLPQIVERAKRYGRIAALLFIDLDRFKSINDSMGHHSGDILLCEVADRLSRTIRISDEVIRLGGDEFTVILEDLKEPEDSAVVADNILQALAETFRLNEHDVHISPSIGIATLPPIETHEELIRAADTAMYAAKKNRGNCYHFFTQEMEDAVKIRVQLERKLYNALQKEEFFLYYQPKIDLKSKRIIGVEALLRWCPDGEFIPPDQFIPLAEELGFIVDIGQWVLHTACRQLQTWRQAGIAPLTMAVNISARQLTHNGFPDGILQVMQRTGIDPSLVQLELTETTAMDDPESAIELLEAIHAMGITLAIDDFGTGYSSLSYLKRLPFDLLKIDKSFVRDMAIDGNDASIVKAIIMLAHNLGLHVIAEGVEDQQQLDFLQAHACDQIQGYYFSRPLPAKELADYWHTMNN